jgi:hypothetical protein
MTTMTPRTTRKLGKQQYRLGVVAAAVVAAEAAYLVLRHGLGIDLAVEQGTTVGPAAVAAAATVAGLAGWALLARRARTIWIVVAAAVYGLSLAGPAGGVSTSAVAGLDILHAVVAIVLIGGLSRRC